MKEHQPQEELNSEKVQQVGERTGDENEHLKETPESPVLLQQRNCNYKWP